MGDDSKIEWTDASWNPVRGCSRVSAGCENCYAEKIAARFSGPGLPYEGLAVFKDKNRNARARKTAWTGEVRFVPERLVEPLCWTRPRRIFVNSMSDLFHEKLTNEQIAAVFGVMAACPQHTFQVLTKRPQRMLAWFEWVAKERTGLAAFPLAPQMICALHATEMSGRSWSVPHVERWPLPNVWLGTSTENQKAADERTGLLLRCPAALHFVSVEPLLGPIRFGLNLSGVRLANGDRWQGALPLLRWVIVGGESGPGARPCKIDWIRGIVAECAEAEVPVFVKQLGALPAVDTEEEAASWPAVDRWFPKHPALPGKVVVQLHDRKGAETDEWPRDLRLRQFPEVSRA